MRNSFFGQYKNLSLTCFKIFFVSKKTIVFSGWMDMVIQLWLFLLFLKMSKTKRLWFNWKTWSDYSLRWEPSEYGNISSIRVLSTNIWVPDLLLYNSADNSFSVGGTVNAVIYYDGTVTYLPPGMFKSTCLIRIDDFPFDQQICELKFGRYEANKYAREAEWLIHIK